MEYCLRGPAKHRFPERNWIVDTLIKKLDLRPVNEEKREYVHTRHGDTYKVMFRKETSDIYVSVPATDIVENRPKPGSEAHKIMHMLNVICCPGEVLTYDSVPVEIDEDEQAA
ncbi:hypothetical protein ACFLQN_02305 [Candidatus Aenigmatarchaeota archaeon]